MDLKRLFQVLVVGGSFAAACQRPRTSGGLNLADGAALPEVGMADALVPETQVASEDATAFEVASTFEVGSTDVDMTADAGPAKDAAVEVASMDVGTAADASAAKDAPDGPSGNPCFCSPTKCCDLHEGAPATVQAGVYCCWGTTC
jgi:hypothetical protein